MARVTLTGATGAPIDVGDHTAIAPGTAKVLPAAELLQRRFAEYIEWGTGIAKSVSQPGAALGDPGPTPRWGWDGLGS